MIQVIIRPDYESPWEANFKAKMPLWIMTYFGSPPAQPGPLMEPGENAHQIILMTVQTHAGLLKEYQNKKPVFFSFWHLKM